MGILLSGCRKPGDCSPVFGHMRPCSKKLKYPSSEMIKWSRRPMPKSSPAFRILIVTSLSSFDGSRLPLG